MELMLAHAGRAFIQAIWIAKVGIVQHVPIHIRPAAVHAVPRLRRQAIELKSLRVRMRMNTFAGRIRSEIRLERIFGDPTFKAGAGPRRALKERGFVIARPRVATRAGLANVARKHQRQIRSAILFGRVEPVIDAFALMNRDRLHGGDIFGQRLEQILRRVGHFANRGEIVIFFLLRLFVQLRFVEGHAEDVRAFLCCRFHQLVPHGVAFLRLFFVEEADGKAGVYQSILSEPHLRNVFEASRVHGSSMIQFAHIDAAGIFFDAVHVKIRAAEQVDFVDHHHRGAAKHAGIFQRLVVAFGGADEHDLHILAEIVAGGTNQVADIFDEEHINAPARTQFPV